MALCWPLTMNTATWFVNVITGRNRDATISELDIRGMVEYCKNFYKKCFETDEELSDKEKESYKHECDRDLNMIEMMIKEYELEKVSPSQYRYKKPCNIPMQPPEWFQYIITHQRKQ